VVFRESGLPQIHFRQSDKCLVYIYVRVEVQGSRFRVNRLGKDLGSLGFRGLEIGVSQAPSSTQHPKPKTLTPKPPACRTCRIVKNCSTFSGLFRVQGSGFEVQGLGFRFLGFGVNGLWFRVLGLRVQG